MRKPFKIKTKHFLAVNEGSTPQEAFLYPWKIFRRADKQGNGEKPLGEIRFSAPDVHQSTRMELCLTEDLTAKEYSELLTELQSGVTSAENTVFILLQSGQSGELQASLDGLGYREDDVEENHLIWEKPVPSWMAIYMCLGLSVGMSFGLATRLGQAPGMCFGIAIGMCLGVMLEKNEKKKRAELLAARKEGKSTDEN